jgi:hypothetical protein
MLNNIFTVSARIKGASLLRRGGGAVLSAMVKVLLCDGVRFWLLRKRMRTRAGRNLHASVITIRICTIVASSKYSKHRTIDYHSLRHVVPGPLGDEKIPLRRSNYVVNTFLYTHMIRRLSILNPCDRPIADTDTHTIPNTKSLTDKLELRLPFKHVQRTYLVFL